jgi:hypothetical protein
VCHWLNWMAAPFNPSYSRQSRFGVAEVAQAFDLA